MAYFVDRQIGKNLEYDTQTYYSSHPLCRIAMISYALYNIMKSESKIFRPNKLKNLILLLGSSAFVTIGVLIHDNAPYIG